MKFYKYQGAGNDFLIADNRDGRISSEAGVLYLHSEDGEGMKSIDIAALCDRRYGVGADGLMLLERSETYDFRMVYFNSDGSGGMMCGNGGRCIVAFAADCGITSFDFEAADGFHTAQILSDEDGAKTVRLKMKDVTELTRYESLDGVMSESDGWFLDTGTRHYVRKVCGLESFDVVRHGRDLRFNARAFLPVGVNVNFIEQDGRVLKVRTYEKGVEDETFACGTGIVASCIAAHASGVAPSRMSEDGRNYFDVKAKRDSLSVDFLSGSPASDVWLTGPAVFVAEVVIK